MELRPVDPERITLHAAIAIGLLAAEHVAPLLLPRAQVYALVKETLAANWSWMETREPELGSLYWSTMGRLIEQDSAMPGDPLLPALHCVLYAQSYFYWTGDAIIRNESPGTFVSLGNDIAEVDESYLTQCLEHAVAVSPRPAETAAWLNGLIERMEREHPVTPDSFVGARIRRAAFEIPPAVPC